MREGEGTRLSPDGAGGLRSPRVGVAHSTPDFVSSAFSSSTGPVGPVELLGKRRVPGEADERGTSGQKTRPSARRARNRWCIDDRRRTPSMPGTVGQGQESLVDNYSVGLFGSSTSQDRLNQQPAQARTRPAAQGTNVPSAIRRTAFPARTAA